MLARLSISNYALIEHLDFKPGSGLSIITGETGAGKSVMLGALGLLKGERADFRVIGDKERKAIVEAEFSNLDETTLSKLLTNDPEWDGKELIIRREILPSGRTRAFVNDSPATLSLLEELTRGLLDIHSQNSNSVLSEQKTQLRLLDAVAACGAEMSDYSKEFNRYVSLRQEIRHRKEEASRNKEQAEIISFRLGQLDKLKPKAGELKKIESRYETLSNSEELRESLLKARRLLYGSEGGGALDLIEEARGVLSDVDFSLWEDEDPEVGERLCQCVVEIKDIAETLEGALGLLEYDPNTLANLSSRMRDYYNAMKTFKVNSDDDLETLHRQVREQFKMAEGDDADTELLEKEAKEVAIGLKKSASYISEKRKEAALWLQQEIEKEARKLGLENLRFEISITETKLSKTGGDNVEFRAAFNKNSNLSPVGDIASGGEIARLMLAIKKITAAHMSLPTIIFDEIDTGVSGSIADRMGEMMKEMGAIMQILTITHLPQVAVKGERHFKVYKEDREERTVSDVMLLSEEQREEEIGRMLSGEEIDEAARTNARSLLKKK